jgi:bifunctional ADP-heptose synthase (sugar kinase/adenylyltransferase)
LSGAASPRDPASKVHDWSDAARWRASQHGRVVFTNGVFDLLHSVRRLKGPARPVRSEAERAYVLAAFEMVDCVVLFDQDTPLELIERLRPDVLVKGGDYSEDTIVGASQVRSWGGSVIVVPLTPGQSTTNIIRTLRGEH